MEKSKQLELDQLNRVNEIVEHWPDERRWAICEGHNAEIAAFIRMAYEISMCNLDVSEEAMVILKLFRRDDPGKVKALKVIGEVLFCLGYEAGQGAE